MKKVVVLLRGVPGAGKSTFAQILCDMNCIHLESDNFWMKDGVYKFEPSRLPEAHAWCISECERAMKHELRIVVSNTFTTEKDIEPYYALAKKYDYNVISLIVENRHGGINTHEVPEKTLQSMESRLRNNIKLR